MWPCAGWLAARWVWPWKAKKEPWKTKPSDKTFRRKTYLPKACNFHVQMPGTLNWRTKHARKKFTRCGLGAACWLRDGFDLGKRRRRSSTPAVVPGAAPALAKAGVGGYVKFLVDTLVLIRVSLQAANCAWPWLNTNSKKDAYQGTSSPSAFELIFVLGRRYRLDMIGQVTSSEENWFLLVLLGTFSASTCWFTFVCRYFIINFTWFWSRRCFQIPGPGVRGHLLYNKCRTCTNYNYFSPGFNML